MASPTDKFASYAAAEKELCDQAGPLLAKIIGELEARHAIRIQEVRVTVGRLGADGTCSDANCVIVE